MKFVNVLFMALFAMFITACNGEKSKAAIEQTAENTMIEEIIEESGDSDTELGEEADEIEFLEYALEALENQNFSSAADFIMSAVASIKAYEIEDEDDQKEAEEAINGLTQIAEKLKSGSRLSAEEFENTVDQLVLFNDEDTITEEEIEE